MSPNYYRGEEVEPMPYQLKNPPRTKCTIKEARFVTAYLEHGVAVRAMVEAGYAKRTAHMHSHKVINRECVKAELARRRAKMVKEAEVTEAWIIERMKMYADSGAILAPYKKVDSEGNVFYDFTGATEEAMKVISEIVTTTHYEGRGEDRVPVIKSKVGTPDPKGALDSLARTKGMFTDKITHQGELTLVERINEGRKRARLRYEERVEAGDAVVGRRDPHSGGDG